MTLNLDGPTILQAVGTAIIIGGMLWANRNTNIAEAEKLTLAKKNLGLTEENRDLADKNLQLTEQVKDLSTQIDKTSTAVKDAISEEGCYLACEFTNVPKRTDIVRLAAFVQGVLVQREMEFSA